MSEDKFEQTDSEKKPLTIELGLPFQVKPDFSKIETFSRDDMVIVDTISFVIPEIGAGRVVIATFLREISLPQQRVENNVVTPLGELDFPQINVSEPPQVPYKLPVTIYLEIDTKQAIAPKIRCKLLVDEKDIYFGSTRTEYLYTESENNNRTTVNTWTKPNKPISYLPYFPPTVESFSQIKFVITSE